MRRSIAPVLLALLLGLGSGVGVSAADEPSAEPTPSASPDPSSPPTPDPSAVPSSSPADDSAPAAGPVASPSPVPSSPAATAAAPISNKADRPDPAGRYIVMLRSDADAAAVLARHAAKDKIKADRRYGSALRGFSARLTGPQRRALLADQSVLAVVPDEVIEVTQTIPTGVSRVGGRSNSIAAIDGIDTRVDADVAIIDTGIAFHPDLNVAGGYNCSTSDRTAWRDVEAHGTHVAGTVAALDNGFGVVGVAPGARLWAVKILNDSGYGLLSWYVCGLDWVLAQRDPADSSRPLIEAVNMSVTKTGSDDGHCGAINHDPLHAAICRVVGAGITVVAAAANDSGSASRRVPAAYNEVITTSALADTDGKAGGLGGHACFSWGTYDADDTFANFSNYGSDVDLIAPGKCILSTRPGSTYGLSSGTSMAAPAVTGAVALYKASRPRATPAEVKEALQYLGNLNWKTGTDPDHYHEKLLDVRRLGPLGTFSVGLGAADVTGEAGGVMNIPIVLTRSPSFFERVRFTVTNLPSGWTAPLTSTSLLGWTANATTMHVGIPLGTARGSYDLRVVATNQGRSDSVTVSIQIVTDLPTAKAPVASLKSGVTLGATSASVRVAWPAATDPSSTIGAYELEASVNGGTWGSTIRTAGTVREITRSAAVGGTSYRFRLRAQDSAGNWSPWVASVSPTRIYVFDDRHSSIAYGGTWARASYTYAVNGTLSRSSRAGSRATLKFTGRGVAVVSPRSRYRGAFDVYVDGVFVRTLSERVTPWGSRRVIYARAWGAVGTHSISLRVRGGQTYPLVQLDAFLVDK
jgi:subtilisin family serine protease